MDNCSTSGKSMPEGKNSEAICNTTTTGHDSMHKLSTDLSGKLQINDENRMNNPNDVLQIPVEGYYIEEGDEEDEEEEDYFSEEAFLAEMGYAKPEPKRDIRGSQQQYLKEEEEEEEDDEGISGESLETQMNYLKNEPPKHEPLTTMADLKLVSALKGSRQKEGKPVKECRVSWAPEVYDPPPSFAESFALSRHESKQKVKGAAGEHWPKSWGKGMAANEGRGKGSRGGGSKGSAGGRAAGKDKKQAKRHGGSSSKSPDYDEN